MAAMKWTSPFRKTETVRSSIQGFVDRAEGSLVVGWAADMEHLAQPLFVDAYVGDVLVASAAADVFRSDLQKAGIGDGKHAFSCQLPTRDWRAETRPLTLRVRDTGVLLQHQGKSEIQLDPLIFLNYIAADIVNNCNLRCPFCLVDYSAVTKTELMSEETFVGLLALIRSVPEGGFWLSCLHEPTLHPRLNDFLELIPLDCRSKVWFTTNLARPLSEDVLEGWAKSGLHHINISLDTMQPELFAVLRKFGKYSVFEANLNRLVDIFKRYPDSPKLRYITMAFQSNIGEIPVIVEHSHRHWLSLENEIRYTYNVAHITGDFRREHYLHKDQWAGLNKALQALPYNHVVVYPPEDGYEEMIQPSANYFDLIKIENSIGTAAPPDFERPICLRARPDGTLMVVGRESQFGVNIHDLQDPVEFFRNL